MSQAEFGQRLAHWLGRPWTRQAVSAAEQGKRAFTAAELFAIAHVLDTRPARLLAPPINVGKLEFPSGATLASRPVIDTGMTDKYLEQIWDELAQVLEGTDKAHKAAKRAQDKLTTVIGISEMSTMHSDQGSPALVEFTMKPPERPEGEQ